MWAYYIARVALGIIEVMDRDEKKWWETYWSGHRVETIGLGVILTGIGLYLIVHKKRKAEEVRDLVAQSSLEGEPKPTDVVESAELLAGSLGQDGVEAAQAAAETLPDVPLKGWAVAVAAIAKNYYLIRDRKRVSYSKKVSSI